MKFRPIREFLSEAMDQCVEIEPTRESLAEKLGCKPEEITSLVHQGFDKRIGWDSHLACVNNRAAGYVDGPILGILIEDH